MVVGIALIILSPVMAMLIQAAVSRQREFLADATGALTTRDPEGLASALQKLEDFGKPMKRQNSTTAHMYISNPLKKGGFTAMFSTHPKIQDRINRLMNNKQKM